jgi:drug/metabolite transporter (DMT)-like permease
VGPLATIALGAIFLDEPITWYQLVGAALVLTGVLAISLAKGK